MNMFKSMELMGKYAECPKCGSDKLGNGQGGLVVEDDTLRRFCKCGWDITVDENGNEVEILNCESCKYLLYSLNSHEDYYCSYNEECIKNLEVCEEYSV